MNEEIMTSSTELTMFTHTSNEAIYETGTNPSITNNSLYSRVSVHRSGDTRDIPAGTPDDSLAFTCGKLLDEKLDEILSLADSQSLPRKLFKKLSRTSRDYSSTQNIYPRAFVVRNKRIGANPRFPRLAIAAALRRRRRRNNPHPHA